jgi:hypothetical protein
MTDFCLKDDAFGPFSDSAATGEDAFTFSSSIVEDIGENSAFDDFGAFGDFQGAGSGAGGQGTPAGESWSSLAGSSVGTSDLSDSMDEFGAPRSSGTSAQAEPAKAENSNTTKEETLAQSAPVTHAEGK